MDAETQKVERSLGFSWNITNVTFTFQVSDAIKSFIKRGMLSTINSGFGALGFVAPLLLSGRTLLRNALTRNIDLGLANLSISSLKMGKLADLYQGLGGVTKT